MERYVLTSKYFKYDLKPRSKPHKQPLEFQLDIRSESMVPNISGNLTKRMRCINPGRHLRIHRVKVVFLLFTFSNLKFTMDQL